MRPKGKTIFFAIEMYHVCRCTDNVFLLLFSERVVRGGGWPMRGRNLIMWSAGWWEASDKSTSGRDIKHIYTQTLQLLTQLSQRVELVRIFLKSVLNTIFILFLDCVIPHQIGPQCPTPPPPENFWKVSWLLDFPAIPLGWGEGGGLCQFCCFELQWYTVD